MNIVGIIAEYNPFHYGHAFHLAQARRITGASHVIVVMSGNYVQRGVPAMFDKYTRAQAALHNGADLVLELPPCTATGSAEYFAKGAVRLLAGTGIVTDLCFGSECGDAAVLERPARILSEEPEAYRTLLKEYLRMGKPYPEARMLALHQYDPTLPADVLKSPNNLLGIEYLKALYRLDIPLRAHTIPRAGASYHDLQMEQAAFASAGGIRQAFLESRGSMTSGIQAQLPSSELYLPYDGKIPVTEDAFSLLLLDRLIQNPGEDLSLYFDVTAELANRIRKYTDAFMSFSQFTDLLKTRNLTRTSVSRALLHILLGIRKYETVNVLRVLGFRKEAASLLQKMTLHGRMPLVTACPDAALPEHWLYADRLYAHVRSMLHGQAFQNECRRKMLVL